MWCPPVVNQRNSGMATLTAMARRLPRPAPCTRNTKRLLYRTTATRNGPSLGTLIEDRENGFGALRSNALPPKPREKGMTQVYGPWATVIGTRYLSDILETMGRHIDAINFAGGSFFLYPEATIREMIEIAHRHGVKVSTGGAIEYVLMHPDQMTTVDKFLGKCKDLGFDIIELSTSNISLSMDDSLRLVDRVHSFGFTVKAELVMQFAKLRVLPSKQHNAEVARSPSRLIQTGERLLTAGVDQLLLGSEGVTANVDDWRMDIIEEVANNLPLERVMFEAANPVVFNWLIREFGIDVNLYVNHSQIIQVASLRSGLWGFSDTWGRIGSFRPPRGE